MQRGDHRGWRPLWDKDAIPNLCAITVDASSGGWHLRKSRGPRRILLRVRGQRIHRQRRHQHDEQQSRCGKNVKHDLCLHDARPPSLTQKALPPGPSRRARSSAPAARAIGAYHRRRQFYQLAVKVCVGQRILRITLAIRLQVVCRGTVPGFDLNPCRALARKPAVDFRVDLDRHAVHQPARLAVPQPFRRVGRQAYAAMHQAAATMNLRLNLASFSLLGSR